MRSTGRFGIVGYSFAFILYQNHVRNCSLRCCACLESDDPRLGHSCGCDVFECDTQSCSGLYHSHRLSFIRPLSLSLFLFVRERCKELEPVAAGGGVGSRALLSPFHDCLLCMLLERETWAKSKYCALRWLGLLKEQANLEQKTILEKYECLTRHALALIKGYISQFSVEFSSKCIPTLR